MTTYNPTAGQQYVLGSSISSTATSILLSSFTEPVTGTPLTMANMNTDIAYGTIAPKTTSSEFISFTGVVQNANGTATLTGVVRGLAKKDPFTTDAAYKLPHSGQSIFILSDMPQVFKQYIPLTNDVTVTGVKTFSSSPLVPTGGTGTQAANATDIANAITGVSGTATNLVAGTTKLSVAAVSAPNPIAVGDNDTRVPTQGENDALVGTSGTPSSTNKYVTNDDTATAATANKVARRLAGGNITVVTESANNNTTNAASTAYVDASVATAHIATTGLSAGPGSSTTQTITHGLGRTPSIIRLYGVSNSPNATIGSQGTTYGVYSSSGNRCVFVLYASGGVSARGTSSVYSISLSSTTGTGTGVVGNVGATTFDIVWTVASGVTDTDFIWECQ